ncbi:hypothetical protein AYM40_28395 [Paraburkholderia phytofirmans OLGA172]|uniref:Uncharacterized protein n=1 Tax=Paraburkholderia phytofirmans OLGA172 TaxID=1417228 RepID=A0A160FST9_9BURK|nr:hypothetical protein [Paraburkholderia phytofirmans]ANB76185.1 hypothetical protein AYM40_28395 [Paraburkholderia phytofirmans OLGA172]
MKRYAPDRGPVKQPTRPKLLQVMGPGLITGASDDDPGGIAGNLREHYPRWLSTSVVGFTLPPVLRILGWVATGVMAATVVAMGVTWVV